MHTTTTTTHRFRRAATAALAAVATAFVGAAGLAAGISAGPAHAAEPVVIENPVAGDPACMTQSGVLGQTFTPGASGDLINYGFWFAADDVPAGTQVDATVSIGWWIDGALLPFHEEDVSFAAPATSTRTMFTSTTPLSLDAGSLYGIMVDFHGVDSCPVGLAPGAAYDGGFMFVDEQQADGDLAFRVEMTAPGPQPGPYVPPSLSGGPPPAGTVGVPYSFQYTVNGSNAPQTALQEGTLPPGITFSETGLLSGTPTQAGTFTPMLKAYDGQNADLLVAIITIREPGLEAPPTAAPPAAAPAPPAAPAVRTATTPHPNRTLAKSGTETVPAVTLAAVSLLLGTALAGMSLVRRRRAR